MGLHMSLGMGSFSYESSMLPSGLVSSEVWLSTPLYPTFCSCWCCWILSGYCVQV